MKIDCDCTDVLHFVDIEYYMGIGDWPSEFIFTVVATPNVTFWQRIKYAFFPSDIALGDVILSEENAKKLAAYIDAATTKAKE